MTPWPACCSYNTSIVSTSGHTAGLQLGMSVLPDSSHDGRFILGWLRTKKKNESFVEVSKASPISTPPTMCFLRDFARLRACSSFSRVYASRYQDYARLCMLIYALTEIWQQQMPTHKAKNYAGRRNQRLAPLGAAPSVNPKQSHDTKPNSSSDTLLPNTFISKR